MNYIILFFEKGVLCTCSITAEDINQARRTFEMISDCEICHIQNTNEQEWKVEQLLNDLFN